MIFGADDRVEITQTTELPWSAIVELEITFPMGGVVATGVMIGPNDLLTVGHAVYGAIDGGYATAIVASPGRSGSSNPFGTAQSVSIQVDPRWVAADQEGADEAFDYDYALITLDRPIGNETGFLSVGVLDDPIGVAMQSGGYPADKGYDFLYRTQGTVDEADSNTLFFNDDLDLTPGQSGSPVFFADPDTGQVTVAGLISFDYEDPPLSNGVLRINPEYRDLIAWWARTNDVTDGDDLVLGGPTDEIRLALDGADTVFGMEGADTLYGGAGADQLNGNLGADFLNGQAGADLVVGGQGDDLVFGGAGNDWHLNGNRGDDRVSGDLGDDAVFGGPGADTLDGGPGRDVLSGDLGDDMLAGGGDADIFAFAFDQGRDVILDFSPGDGDVIRLAVNINGSGIGTATQALAHLVADGADSLLEFGAGNAIRIAGVGPTAFDAGDFWVG